MNIKFIKKLFLLFAFTILVYSCEEETVTPTEENLLLNSSFEKDGNPAAVGWTLPAGSEFSTDVPANGGSYSLLLNSSAPPETFAYIKVPVKTNYTVNKLSFWAKGTGISSSIYGKAILTLIRNGVQLKSDTVFVDQIVWRNFSIQNTYDVAQGDSFLVRFSGGASQLFSGKTFFDVCQLQGIR